MKGVDARPWSKQGRKTVTVVAGLRSTTRRWDKSCVRRAPLEGPSRNMACVVCFMQSFEFFISPWRKVKCVQLRSRVAGLEDELAAITRRFAALDHTWDEKRVAMEDGRAEACSRADGLVLELVQVRSYIHSTLSTEYGREGNEPSKHQLAFRRL